MVTWSLGQLSDRTERGSQGFATYRWKPRFPTILKSPSGRKSFSLWHDRFIFEHAQSQKEKILNLDFKMVYRATSTISNLGSKLCVASAFRGNLRDASSLLCIFTTLQSCIFAIFASLNFYNVAYLLFLQNLFCPKQSKG